VLSNNRGQIFTLIEILVVAVIVVGAGYFVTTGYLGHGGLTKSKPGEPATPVERAQGVDCMNNLRQIRYAIDTYQQTNDKIPALLSDMESLGISGAVTKCPISKKEYSYDASQGKVSCATPGHEKY